MSEEAGHGSESGAKSHVRYVEIAADDAGQRLDNFLLRALKGVPRARIYRAIRRGEVRVNKGRVAQTYRLIEDDIVRLPPISPASRHPPKAGDFDWAARIVHEDRQLLVVDKPSGWAVHGGSGVRLGVIESMRANLPDRPVLELVHRLDRSTSGCLVLAKRRSALRVLHEQFRDGEVRKRYLLLVAGDWQHGERTVDIPLDVSHRRGGERTVRVAADGRRAVTRFRLVSGFGDVSLLEAEPQTGRTHQIRVHAAHCEHPIVGDERYGDAGVNRRFHELGLTRLFLHAASIEFDYPADNPCLFSVPLAADLREVLDRLETRGARRSPRHRR